MDEGTTKPTSEDELERLQKERDELRHRVRARYPEALPLPDRPALDRLIERLGLGPDVLLARNPRLVIGRVTGWGQDGPRAMRAGHDVNYIALSGALHGFGRKNGKLAFPANTLGDNGGGGMMLAFGLPRSSQTRSMTRPR